MSSRSFPNRVYERRRRRVVICGERLENEIALRDRTGSTPHRGD